MRCVQCAHRVTKLPSGPADRTALRAVIDVQLLFGGLQIARIHTVVGARVVTPGLQFAEFAHQLFVRDLARGHRLERVIRALLRRETRRGKRGQTAERRKQRDQDSGETSHGAIRVWARTRDGMHAD
ncbi:hypothetical protein PT2222_220016 [Paraburkholderia tropica]